MLREADHLEPITCLETLLLLCSKCGLDVHFLGFRARRIASR